MKKVAVALHAKDDFKIEIISNLCNLDFIHVDVMDGIFVNNIMLNLDIFKVLKKHVNIPIIAHLMVVNPIDYISKIFNYIDAVFFHFEVKHDKLLIIKKIKHLGKKIGLVLNPPTPISNIIPLLKVLDYILIMGVNPGWSGQKFIPEIVDKVNLLANYKKNYHFLIDVDGGVNIENAKLLKNADILSSSSTILKADNPNKVINLLKQI